MARRDLPFTNRNWIILGGGVAVIAAGYGLLSIPPADGFLSLTMAPILLVLGYCVVIPWAILYKDSEARESPGRDREAG